MKLGCGLWNNDEFLKNIDNSSDDFKNHIDLCDLCKKDFLEITMAKTKMSTFDSISIPADLKFGKILLKVKDKVMEIIDALSGTRYGAQFAVRGEVNSTKREVIYDSKNTKIFVNLYDADEIVLSIRINDYGDIEIFDEKGNILRSSNGKSGIDIRVKHGKYTIKHGMEEVVFEFAR